LLERLRDVHAQDLDHVLQLGRGDSARAVAVVRVEGGAPLSQLGVKLAAHIIELELQHSAPLLERRDTAVGDG